MFADSNDITYCKVLSDSTHIFKASNMIRSLFLFLLNLLIPLNQPLSCGRSIILANLLVHLKCIFSKCSTTKAKANSTKAQNKPFSYYQ